MFNLSIRAKQLLAFCFMIVLIAVCGYWGLRGAGLIQHELDTTFNINLKALDLLIESDRDLQQLLVAERTLLFAEPGSESFDGLRADYAENFEQSLTRWTDYTKLAQTEAEKEYFPQYDAARKAWEALTAQVVSGAAGDAQQREAARTLSLGDAAAAFETMRDVLDKLTEVALTQAEASEKAAKSAYRNLRLGLLSMTLLGVLVGVLLTFGMTASIVRPLNNLAHAAHQIAQGDLSMHIPPAQTKDELGRLTAAFQEMKDQVRRLIQQINNSATEVSGASRELLSTADEATQAVQQVSQTVESVAGSAQTASDSVQQARLSLDQIAAAMQNISKDIEDVAHYATRASGQGEEGFKSANSASEINNRAALSVQETRGVVQALGEKTQQIGQFISIITGIADQTNLLALNAAIEAARAGDAGRGFAVVAEEVRKLAEESNQAAGNITKLVKSIESEMQTAITAMERSDSEVAHGAQTVGEAGALLGEIVSSVHALNDKVQSISAAAEEITASTGEVVGLMHGLAAGAEANSAAATQVASATQQQAASVHEIGANAGKLARLSQQMEELVQQFKL